MADRYDLPSADRQTLAAKHEFEVGQGLEKSLVVEVEDAVSKDDDPSLIRGKK
jgi:hypothetical protein